MTPHATPNLGTVGAPTEAGIQATLAKAILARRMLETLRDKTEQSERAQAWLLRNKEGSAVEENGDDGSPGSASGERQAGSPGSAPTAIAVTVVGRSKIPYLPLTREIASPCFEGCENISDVLHPPYEIFRVKLHFVYFLAPSDRHRRAARGDHR